MCAFINIKIYFKNQNIHHLFFLQKFLLLNLLVCQKNKNNKATTVFRPFCYQIIFSFGFKEHFCRQYCVGSTVRHSSVFIQIRRFVKVLPYTNKNCDKKIT